MGGGDIIKTEYDPSKRIRLWISYPGGQGPLTTIRLQPQADPQHRLPRTWSLIVQTAGSLPITTPSLTCQVSASVCLGFSLPTSLLSTCASH